MRRNRAFVSSNISEWFGKDPFQRGNVFVPEPIQATGGDILDSNGYRIHTFTSNGTFSVESVGTTSGEIEYLVVAGGGGGTKNNYVGSGGGGAGTNTGVATIDVQDYSVTIGSGGSGTSSNNSLGTSGIQSTFSSFVASPGLCTDLNSNASGNGFAGGPPAAYIGAGGGGAAGEGLSGTGGPGLQWYNEYFGGGGAGGVSGNPSQSGGIGGGGDSATSATINTGGGGGGGSVQAGTSSGNGGSGIVIIRYPFS